MATWKPDLLKGNRGSYSRDAKGVARWTIYESGNVTGLTGGGSQIMTEAVATEGVPQLDSTHPVLTDLALDEIQPEVLGQNEVHLKLVYRERVKTEEEPITIDYGCSLQQTQVNTSFNNEDELQLMPVDFTIGGVSQGIQFAFSSVLVANHVRTYTWRQKFEEIDPRDMCLYFSGRVNIYDLFKEDDGMKWLASLTARSGDSGETWDMTLQLLYREDRWYSDVVWIDPQINRPPEGITLDNGRKLYRCYRYADLRVLEMPGMLPPPP